MALALPALIWARVSERQQVGVVGFFLQPDLDPFLLFFVGLGGVDAAPAVAEDFADVDRPDGEEEAGPHQHGQDGVDDFDDVAACPPRKSNTILCSLSPPAISPLLLLRRGLSHAPARSRTSQDPSEQDTQLKQNKQRNHLDQHRDRVDAGQRGGHDRDHQVGVAAVLGELLDR